MEGHCSTGQSLQWAVVPMEEKEEYNIYIYIYIYICMCACSWYSKDNCYTKNIWNGKFHENELFFYVVTFQEMKEVMNVICLHKQNIVKLMFCILAGDTF